MIKSSSKDMNKILRALNRLGWTVEKRGNCHIRVTNLNGEIVTISNTCSDGRGFMNARSDLRKIGAPV